MKKSKDEKVQQFLEEMLLTDSEKFDILQELRSIVFVLYPQVHERIMYGGIMFACEEDWGGIFASKKHVSFEFGNGCDFKDLQKQLEGTGKHRRHLKIHDVDEIERKDVAFYVKQAV